MRDAEPHDDRLMIPIDEATEIVLAAEQSGWQSATTLWRWIAIAAMVAGVALGVAAGRAHAETVDGDRIMVIDGDTVALPCDPAKGIYPGCAERIRLEGIDAPETWQPRCEAERIRGYEAKAKLVELLRGHEVEVTRIDRDRYGRTLARLEADGIDVEGPMLASGHAVVWAPGRAAWADRCRHWCPGAPRCEE